MYSTTILNKDLKCLYSRDHKTKSERQENKMWKNGKEKRKER
jgi:hypothetical protein